MPLRHSTRRSTASRAACRGLFLDLLWPVTEAGDARPADGIVEQSCDVIAQAPTLVRLFPEARFVHVVRDGRDAASRVSQTRGLVYPRNRRQGLEWWEARVRRIDEGARAIRDDRLLEIELGSFLTRGRREQLRNLASHAGIQAGNRLEAVRTAPDEAAGPRTRSAGARASRRLSRPRSTRCTARRSSSSSATGSAARRSSGTPTSARSDRVATLVAKACSREW